MTQSIGQARLQDDTSPTGGNPASLIRDALMRELLREVEDEVSGRTATRLELMARALVDKAIGGDVAASRETLDRTAGKTLSAVPESETEPQMVTFEWLDHDPESAT